MIKQKIAAVLFIIILVVNFIFLKPFKVIYIDSTSDLENLFSTPQKNIEVHLEEGIYSLKKKVFIDSSCGNCENPDTLITASKGLQISGKNVKLIGSKNGRAIIKTKAGYGLFIKDCNNCILENLVITEGIRDTNPFATDAAIVVKNSDVSIRNNLIHKNLGDSSIVSKDIVGIMGICGRENSKLKIINNEILRNSWDGITLYRDAQAIINNNIIDGISRDDERYPYGGRGVAIGITWNASATIKNNLLKRYWKGIGLFVNAEADLEKNIIEDMTTWGISLWDAGEGNPKGKIKNNIIYNCGAMGVSISSSTETNPGYFTNNVIVETAQDSSYDSDEYYGYQCALAKHSIPKNFIISDNIFYNNRVISNKLPDYNVSKKEFNRIMQLNSVWMMNISHIAKSNFYRKFIE